MTLAKELPSPRHQESDVMFLLAIGLMAGAAAYVFLSAILALSGLGINYDIALFWVCMALGFFSFGRGLSWTARLKLLAASLTIYLLHNLLVDPSYDGRTYHLPVSIELAKGLNLFLDQSQSIWGNIYPSGTWRIHAALSSIGIGLNNGLFLNSCLLAASYIVTEHATRGLVREAEPWRRFLCLMAAASPVVVAQISTALVDGAMGSLHLILVMSGYLLARGLKRTYLVLFASAGILLVSTKTSGVYFFAISALAVFAILMFRQSPQRWSAVAQFSVVLFAASVIALAANYKPIVTNIYQFGSPLPDTGPILDGQKPTALQGHGQVYEITSAIFSRVGGNICCAEPLTWKIPGSFDLNELKNAKQGPRTGGFGPFYGLVLLAGIASLSQLRTEGNPNWPFMIMLASGAISCLLFPEPWWARYVPFIGCLAPLFMIAAGWNPRRPLQLLVAAIMSINAVVFLGSAVSANITHRKSEDELRRLTAENDVVIGIGGGQAIFVENFLRMRGIPASVGTCASPTSDFFGLPVCRQPFATTLRPEPK